jgi:hypothetical protein
MPSRRQVRVAKQRRIKTRPRVPQERRTPPKGAGREQPREHSGSRRKNKQANPESVPKKGGGLCIRGAACILPRGVGVSHE